MGFSMGDVKNSLNRPFYLNSANPASYSYLRAATFSLGAMLSRTRTFNSETSQDNDNGTLRYFGLGVPLTPKLSFAIGARPFTSLGYGINIESDITYPSELTTRYEGEGGMNIAYGGLGYKIVNDSNHSLSLGVNANLYFGNENQLALNILDNTTGALNSMYKSTYVTSDFGFDVGVIYELYLNEIFNSDGHINNTLTLGGTYTIPTHLDTKFEYFQGSYFNNGAVAVITDTLNFRRDTTSIYLPQRLGLGATYTMHNRHSNAYLIISADYDQTNWSELLINGEEQSLENSQNFGLGLQFIPDAEGRRAFFSILRYRFGVNYGLTRINILDNHLVNYSVTAGFGIPLVKSKSIYPASSTIDFGIKVGSRGTEGNGLIREQYTNIYIGLSFSPNYWDRWFKKRRIN